MDDTDPFQPNHMAKLVRQLADALGLPATFTLDACRHGGMTELEEAELTTGQGRALSGHQDGSGLRGYAKRTLSAPWPRPASGTPTGYAERQNTGNNLSE